MGEGNILASATGHLGKGTHLPVSTHPPKGPQTSDCVTWDPYAPHAAHRGCKAKPQVPCRLRKGSSQAGDGRSPPGDAWGLQQQPGQPAAPAPASRGTVPGKTSPWVQSPWGPAGLWRPPPWLPKDPVPTETSRGEKGCGLLANHKGRTSDAPGRLEPVGMTDGRPESAAEKFRGRMAMSACRESPVANSGVGLRGSR